MVHHRRVHLANCVQPDRDHGNVPMVFGLYHKVGAVKIFEDTEIGGALTYVTLIEPVLAINDAVIDSRNLFGLYDHACCGGVIPVVVIGH